MIDLTSAYIWARSNSGLANDVTAAKERHLNPGYPSILTAKCRFINVSGPSPEQTGDFMEGSGALRLVTSQGNFQEEL